MSSAAFVIGDWIVYGEDHFRGQQRLPNFESESIGARRVSSEIYNEALRLTGLDRSTFITYAYVARRVSASLRNEQLSWEHHKAVANPKFSNEINHRGSMDTEDQPFTEGILRVSRSPRG